MQGLILKDFYNMKKNIGASLVTTICVGLLLMVQGNPSMFVVGVTLAGGSICSSCLKMDETAGWSKFELTAPISRVTVVLEKYALMLMLTLPSVAFGSIISYVAGTVTDSLELDKFLLYVSVGFSLAIITGSLITFCVFKFGVIKADFFTTICYLVPVGIFIAVLLLMEKLGIDIFVGSSWQLVTFMLPVAALAFMLAIALLAVHIYRKKQF